MLAFAGMVAPALLLWALWWAPLHDRINATRERIVTAEEDLRWMRTQAGRAAALRGTQRTTAAPAGTGFLTAIERASKDNGVQLNQVRPNGAGSAQIRIDQAPFEQVVRWLDQLERGQGIRPERVVIDRLEPGQVSLQLSLTTDSQSN